MCVMWPVPSPIGPTCLPLSPLPPSTSTRHLPAPFPTPFPAPACQTRLNRTFQLSLHFRLLCWYAFPACCAHLARPKSASLKYPVWVTKIFEGLMSRCIIPGQAAK